MDLSRDMNRKSKGVSKLKTYVLYSGNSQPLSLNIVFIPFSFLLSESVTLKCWTF